METINWKEFTRKIAVKSDVKTMYNAWTIPSEIEKWFLESANYQSRNGKPTPRNTNVHVGDSYKWTWHLYDEVEEGTIKEANGVDTFQFSFAGTCPVRVILKQADDHVIVELTQSNIPTDDASKKNIRLGCDHGWSFYLVNLKSVYEGGLDLRNKEAYLKGMLNS